MGLILRQKRVLLTSLIRKLLQWELYLPIPPSEVKVFILSLFFSLGPVEKPNVFHWIP